MKITPVKPKNTVVMKTSDAKAQKTVHQWWKAKNQTERAKQLVDTAAYLKESQNSRFKQAAIYAKLYGNHSLFSFVGSNINKLDGANNLPADRPTFNIIQSASDTLVSRISQNRPTPVFLTDNGDYKERNLAKKLNNFILGEFYQTKAYDKAALILRDACVEGTGCLKVYETADNRVGIDRVLLTELFVDPNEAVYGEPRQLYQLKLVDREVLMDAFPQFRSNIEKAERATVDNSADASKSVSDLVLVVEGWRLPSGKETGDGRHTIACSAGMILDEEWEKDKFPFVFLHYSPRLLGFWAQGLAEQLMGTQIEINSLLYTISRAIKLVGVPRVFQEDGSKVVRSHHNNDIGVIVTYQGTKPSYEVAQANAPELYQQLQRLIDYGYQQCGVSALDASAQKPAGLNSGEAIRSYDDISTDRFAALSRRYDNLFVDLAYLVVETAKDIAERTGKYSTVYPGKDGTKKIDLPKASLIKDPFVIQAFNMSSLPRDPAGRLAKVTEMAQAGMITLREARRLLDFPDLSQIEKLQNAAEERIFQILDAIVEDGEYTAPDPFTDLALAKEFVVQYINLYGQAKLEEEKMQMLRTYFTQVNGLLMAAQPPAPPPGAAPGGPQAVPAAPPVSPLLPNAPAAA
jgi:hypothetical protein